MLFSLLSSEDVASIILHIVFIATFIIIFFFTYGSYLEEKVIKQQMSYITNDFVSSLGIFAPTVGPILKAKLNASSKPVMSEADQQAATNNRSLRNKSLMLLAVVIIIGFGSVYYISRRYGFTMKEILIANTVSLFALGLTYFLFSTYFVAYYRSMDPNFVKKKFLEAIRDQAI